MYEENRRFDWAGLFIKLIIVVIFILFTVWLLSLSNKGMSTSIGVLTDNVFAGNIDKMKEVGKSYFTTERLPEKVGEVSTLTLDRMYDKKLLLPLKDKNGKNCSASGSYVSVQKMDKEYQMKVYLECPERTDYVVVIMGCYNYCDEAICEKKDLNSLEYEYKKTANGYWSSWSGWSDWSKTKVTKTDSRDVETKVVREDYTYEKDVTETKVVGNATCANVSGYALVSNKNGVCTYSKTTDDKKNPTCPSVSGYTLTNRDGFNCSYKSNTPSYKNPTCPSVSGYSLTSRNGFTCNYSNTYTSSTDYDLVYYGTGSGSYVPADTSTRHYVQSSADYQYKCTPGCAFQWYYTYKIYTKQYKTVTETTTRTASCPSGYTQSGNECVKSGTTTTTKTASCPSGYTKSGNECVKYPTTTKTASCPSGYTKSGDTCIKSSTSTTTKNATCPSGQTLKDKKCYKDVTTMVTVEGTRNVTYYRYRTREYSGGSIDYKWSPSNNDKTLLDAGYKLTGKTREVGGK